MIFSRPTYETVSAELGHIFREVERRICPSVSTLELDNVAQQAITSRGLANLIKDNRRNEYPWNITASVNHEIVNTPPNTRSLKNGDLLSLQIAVGRAGVFACQGWTYPVGSISEQDSRLICAGISALKAAIHQVAGGNAVPQISSAIESSLVENGYQPGRDFVGHAVGKDLHEAPAIPCYVSRRQSAGPDLDSKLFVGQILSINVFAHAGSPRTKTAKDGWSLVSRDGKKSAHFSGMVSVAEEGGTILTNGRAGWSTQT